MKLFFILIATVLLTGELLSAAESVPQDKSTAQAVQTSYPMHQIGVAASMISGTGISYSFIFNEKMRIKLNGIYYYSKDNSDVTDWASIGLEFQHNFLKMKVLRIYGLIGGSYWFSNNSDNTYKFFPHFDVTHDLYSTSDYRFGIGLGFDLTFWSHFVMGADIGYDYENGTKTYKNSTIQAKNLKDVGFACGVTIGFLF